MKLSPQDLCRLGRSSWKHWHSHNLERHWGHLHIQGDQWKLWLWQCWWQWKDCGNYDWIFLQGNQYWKFINKQMKVRGENHTCADQKLNASFKPKPYWWNVFSEPGFPKVINEMYPHSPATQRRYLKVSLESHAIWTQPCSPRPTTRCTSSRWTPSRCTSS